MMGMGGGLLRRFKKQGKGNGEWGKQPDSTVTALCVSHGI
jgi:hypothetical protein